MRRMTKPTRSSRSAPCAPTPDPLGSGALEQTCFHVSRAYSNYVTLLERVLSALDLAASVKPGMGHVLFALFEQDDLIIKDLVHRVSLSPSTLTGILTKMEAGGLVTRVADAADRRAVRISLTAHGRSLRKRCMLALRRVNAVMEAELSGADVKATKLALAAMNRAMLADNRRGARPGTARRTTGRT